MHHELGKKSTICGIAGWCDIIAGRFSQKYKLDEFCKFAQQGSRENGS